MFVFPPGVSSRRLIDKSNDSHISNIRQSNHARTSIDVELGKDEIGDGDHRSSFRCASDLESVFNASEVSSSTDPDEFKRGCSKQNAPIGVVHVLEDSSTGERSAPSVASGVRFVNKPQGTPLFTILEQQSLATLRSRASDLAFTISNGIKSRGHHQVSDGARRTESRRPASADEVALSHLRKVQAMMNEQHLRNSSSEHSDLRLQFSPLFLPPIRPRTPDGFRKCSGDSSVSRSHLARRSEWSQRLRRKLSRVGLRAKSLWRYGIPVPRPDINQWRPPASGHYTTRYGSHSDHPFHDAQLAPAIPLLRRPVSMGTALLRTAVVHPSQSHSRSISEGSSSAQRSLSAISGHAIPVTSARALSPSMPRTATLPRSQTSGGRASSSPCPAFSTRTVELLAQFPLPPLKSEHASHITAVDSLRIAYPSPLRPRTVRPSLLTFLEQTDDDNDAAESTSAPGTVNHAVRTMNVAQADEQISDLKTSLPSSSNITLNWCTTSTRGVTQPLSDISASGDSVPDENPQPHDRVITISDGVSISNIAMQNDSSDEHRRVDSVFFPLTRDDVCPHLREKGHVQALQGNTGPSTTAQNTSKSQGLASNIFPLVKQKLRARSLRSPRLKTKCWKCKMRW